MAAAELAEGDAAMLEADGVEAGAEELVAVVAAPPQAVRLSRAAAATPATVKVVRLIDCISILLVSADLCRADEFLDDRFGSIPTVGHLPLVGVSMGIRQLRCDGWVILEESFSAPGPALPATS
jgi:hypothetical protein